MSKNKQPEINSIDQMPVEVSPFPEGHVMHEWDYNTQSRDAEILAERSRETLNMVDQNESDFYIPPEWGIDGFQLAWIVEWVMGKPQPDNLRKRQRQGWQFVHESEIPQLKMELMNHTFDKDRNDGWIRAGGQILMKKPQQAYDQDQNMKMQRGEEVRRQSLAMTQYMSNGIDPRFVVENKSYYQPNHKMGRR